MAAPQRIAEDPVSGVYYRREDYAGFVRRMLVDLVDIGAAGCLTIAIYAALWEGVGWFRDAGALFMAVTASVGFGYFVVLKRSRWRTLGYRLGGVKIVGLDGARAGWGALTFRLSFMLLGPLNWVIDLFWLSGDPHRQAIRDKFARTYVVRANAEPAGEGRVAIRYYEICGYNFLFREVVVA